MKKLSAILFFLLLPTILLPVFVGQARATSAFYAWGTLCPDSPAPTGEADAEYGICEIVRNWIPSNWIRWNFYGSQTYPSHVQNILQTTESQGYYDHTLWVGDFCPRFDNGNQHWAFYSGEGHTSEFTWDYQVYNWAYPHHYQMSEFIWTCSCGGLYFNQLYPTTPHYAIVHDSSYIWYGYYDQPANKIVGMPYAWSGLNNGMQTDGYVNYNNNDPTAYIGWENSSPYLKNTAHNGALTNYYFLYWYYNYALGKFDGWYHNSHQSLDFASGKVYGQTFGNSPYWYGWLNEAGTWTRMRAMGNQGAP